MATINSTVRRWVENAREAPEEFWARAANELPWFRKWDRVFEPDYPSFRWFPGAETNLAYNCLDHHVANGRGDHTALIYVNERGARERFTYSELTAEVERIAAGLRGLGIGKGDRLTTYMPISPEAIMAMLATVRIGAIHSVVFAGFGAGALAERIDASGSRLVFTADVGYRKGAEVKLKEIVDSALKQGGEMVEHVVVLRRGDGEPSASDRELGWDEFLDRGEGHDGGHVPLEANEPAYILATSGTTAKPKLAIATHGGYQVHIHSMGRWAFDLRPDDVWWSTSDIGWVVGHSYIVYAPLLAGCTTIAYEGAIDHPGPETVWQVIEELGVTGVFTSPTAVRLLMRYGEGPARKYDFSSLERVFCAGEVLNAPVWEWLQKVVLEDRIPVIDHMWQTETGGPIFGNPYGLEMLPIKPGSAGHSAAGHRGCRDDSRGRALRAGREGDHGHQTALPGPDADAVGRAGQVRRGLLGASAGGVLHGGTRRTSTRTATSGSPDARTRSSRSQPTGSARSRSRPPSSSTLRWPRPA